MAFLLQDHRDLLTSRIAVAHDLLEDHGVVDNVGSNSSTIKRSLSRPAVLWRKCFDTAKNYALAATTM